MAPVVVSVACLLVVETLRQAAVLAIAMALGVAFVRLRFGFSEGFRRLVLAGDGAALAGAVAIPAIAAPAVILGASQLPDHGRFVAPLGLPLLLGAALFGLGMQVANACGSGALVAIGKGSRRMAFALPAFVLGGLLGSILLPMLDGWAALPAIDLVALWGPWRGLLVTEVLLLALGTALARGAPAARAAIRAGSLIGALAGLLALASGMPWGITTGLTLVGARAAQGLGMPVASWPFWADGWAATALSAPLLANHSVLADLGLVLGAWSAASATGSWMRAPLSRRGMVGAVLGGLLMGVGARLSFGCNIGAFASGMASGSLHGLLWFLVVLPGCWLGVRLRPWFGFTADRMA